ncbi:restriction endonuclease subunit S [Vibrio parahaemolyticus]|uniref:restriction endonuclease subunit S n=1 Tax=Vibrio parahaemolyticus TaxID=670 RepID=UPI0009AB99E6|nr:restriction endonuclease subunit S [Vibrio parahaemolyticus]EGR0734815.1 restriction endonuclease subunit S [Vibrio parahaemolyticus]MDF4880976.1 restriction endonuclease subunit S [Vibrio parahaemolyticus]TNZ88633.1 restriction endonuclease subunit S [Vibrio parahaemolyticus]TOA10397.1 restriction endonuclease subunit S [Vibrio parahaemolyticus]HCM0405368.1 restriction endonuclease subunit S [Vibrio parahaemolyticus]
MTEQMNVPKLRFGEFNEALARKTLEEVAEKIQDGTHFSPPLDEEGTCLYLTSKNIRNGFMLLEDISYISELEHKKIYKRCDVKRGDVLLTKDGASTGNCCINTLDSEFSLLSSVAFIRADANHHNNFIYQSIASQAGQKLIRGAISGQAITRITLTKLRNFKFYFPTLPEQQKIASFLSKVDEKIALLSEKKDKLTEYKKGVMQHLFNGSFQERDGQLTFIPPTLRFKADDGSEFPDWEEVTLGELCNITTGKLDANAMVAGGEYRFYTCAKEHYQIDKYAFDTEALLISGNGANVGYIHYYNGKFNAYQRTYVLDSFNSSHIHFVKCFLDRNLKKRIMQEKNDGNTPYIVLSTLKDMKVLLPNKQEQALIANFLSTIDKKIDLVNSELEKAKEWKKGLLQQMFV